MMTNLYICKNCKSEFKRYGITPGVFCCLGCKAEWQRNQKEYDYAWLYQRYIVEGLGTYQIAKLVNRDPKRVYEWLIGYGIPIREREWSVETGIQPFHDKDWLYAEYVEKSRSANDIAHQFEVTEGNILHFLRKFSIERRTISEARDVKYWGVSGTDNPMFGRTGENAPNWKGGSTPERQAFYQTEEWQVASREIWKRDEGFCQRCGIHANHAEAMHIHHIVSFAVAELRAEVSNLILFCSDCHRWVHSLKNVDKEFIQEL